MTDPEKIAAIKEVFDDLAGLRAHIAQRPDHQLFGQIEEPEDVAAKTDALLKVAEILGIKIAKVVLRKSR